MAETTLTDHEIVKRANEFYDRVRGQMEAEHFGEYIAIDAVSGAYRTYPTHLGAIDKLEHDLPEAAIYTKRIGYDAAVVMGGSWHRDRGTAA